MADSLLMLWASQVEVEEDIVEGFRNSTSHLQYVQSYKVTLYYQEAFRRMDTWTTQVKVFRELFIKLKIDSQSEMAIKSYVRSVLPLISRVGFLEPEKEILYNEADIHPFIFYPMQ